MILIEDLNLERVTLEMSVDEFKKLIMFFGEEKLGPYEHQLCPYDQWQEWEAKYKPSESYKISNLGGSLEIRPATPRPPLEKP